MTRKFTKICQKHPHLNGERMISNGACVACKNEKRHIQARNKYHNDPEYKIRYLKNRARLKAKWNRYAEYSAAYQSAKDCRTPSWANLHKISEIYRRASKLGMTVDHIIPLRGKTVSGLHVENNLRIISQHENDSKGNKFIEELICTN